MCAAALPPRCLVQDYILLLPVVTLLCYVAAMQLTCMVRDLGATVPGAKRTF